MNELKPYDLLCLGFCSIDHLAVLPEIPLDGKVEIIRKLRQGGGPAASAAVAAARLGKRVAFCGVTGSDEAGDQIVEGLSEEGIDVSGIIRRAGCDSPVAYCWIEQGSGKRSIAWSHGSAPELSAAEVNPDLIRSARMLHLDGHQNAAARAAVKIARAAGILVSLDAGTMREGMDEIIAETDIFLASEAFARAWTKEEDLEQALCKMAQTGARITGITLGEKGSMAWENGKIIRCAAFNPGVVVDTTGAGDSFHGAFAVRYLECGDLRESMRFASAVAALKCRILGGRSGLPERRSVEEFLKTHSDKEER